LFTLVRALFRISSAAPQHEEQVEEEVEEEEEWVCHRRRLLSYSNPFADVVLTLNPFAPSRIAHHSLVRRPPNVRPRTFFSFFFFFFFSFFALMLQMFPSSFRFPLSIRLFSCRYTIQHFCPFTVLRSSSLFQLFLAARLLPQDNDHYTFISAIFLLHHLHHPSLF
jgi:hypothetical protein